jgi:hypothetical protein
LTQTIDAQELLRPVFVVERSRESSPDVETLEERSEPRSKNSPASNSNLDNSNGINSVTNDLDQKTAPLTVAKDGEVTVETKPPKPSEAKSDCTIDHLDGSLRSILAPMFKEGVSGTRRVSAMAQASSKPLKDPIHSGPEPAGGHTKRIVDSVRPTAKGSELPGTPSDDCKTEKGQPNRMPATPNKAPANSKPLVESKTQAPATAVKTTEKHSVRPPGIAQSDDGLEEELRGSAERS